MDVLTVWIVLFLVGTALFQVGYWTGRSAETAGVMRRITEVEKALDKLEAGVR